MIVSNSTPLIAFARIGELTLLQRLVGRLLVPDTVWQEVVGFPDRPGAKEIEGAAWIERQIVRDVPAELLAMLDRGEAEVIALSEKVRAAEVLLNERAARAVAFARGLRVIGTAGLLVRAKGRGHISAVRPFLERMQLHGIRYGNQFLHALFRQLGEE
jgi:predicted nucleic acid-binding protein